MSKKKVTVNILGHDWEIRDVAPKKLPTNAWGMAIYPDRIIMLSSELTLKMRKVTLLHECRHGYQFESGSTNVLGQQALELDADGFASFALSLKAQGVL